MIDEIVIITDPELGELDNADTNDVVTRIDELPKEAPDAKVKNEGQEDIEAYKTAWAEQDVDTLELLRAKHPEDARFSLHLSLIDLSADEAQDFSEVNDNHKKLLKELGLNGAPEFIRLLEENNPKKLRKYVEELPEANPLKKSMLILLKYL